ncbi:uncharacterized protein LOC143804003 [Ranitomeya variabilis]|uniref:uncharacterized protein LOC143804003 n=1 Tax=Ranitomeya variabilis TaxID=490064 RepID=UPI0040562610
MDIFSKNTPAISQDTSFEIKDLMHKYRNALQRKTRLWWNRSSLENYVDKKIIPRGLRIQLYPTYDLGELELTKRWISVASKCSFEFMDILIAKNTLSLSEVDRELEETYKRLSMDMPKEQLAKWSKDLEIEVNVLEERVSQDKLKKFQRDVGDYDADKVFRCPEDRETLDNLIALEEENNTTETLLLDIIDKAFTQGIVSKKLLDTVRRNQPKLPTFYLIPKLHKNALDPPGRPIVSDSSHPSSTIRGIPIGQFLRAKRICSNEENFNKQAIDLTSRFLDRGYSKRIIKRGYQRAVKLTRDQLLYRTSIPGERTNDNQIRLCVSFVAVEWKPWMCKISCGPSSLEYSSGHFSV